MKFRKQYWTDDRHCCHQTKKMVMNSNNRYYYYYLYLLFFWKLKRFLFLLCSSLLLAISCFLILIYTWCSFGIVSFIFSLSSLWIILLSLWWLWNEFYFFIFNGITICIILSLSLSSLFIIVSIVCVLFSIIFKFLTYVLYIIFTKGIGSKLNYNLNYIYIKNNFYYKIYIF